jgi:uncharacterized phage-associated protein
MQLIKLTYLAHGWTLGLLGRPLVSEHAEAWEYGPVFPDLYQVLKGFRSDPVPSVPKSRAIQFDEPERQIVDQVALLYGKLTGIQLSRLTHLPRSPWSLTREFAGRSAPISNDLIEQYYREQAEDARQRAAA